MREIEEIIHFFSVAWETLHKFKFIYVVVSALLAFFTWLGFYFDPAAVYWMNHFLSFVDFRFVIIFGSIFLLLVMIMVFIIANVSSNKKFNLIDLLIFLRHYPTILSKIFLIYFFFKGVGLVDDFFTGFLSGWPTLTWIAAFICSLVLLWIAIFLLYRLLGESFVKKFGKDFVMETAAVVSMLSRPVLYISILNPKLSLSEIFKWSPKSSQEENDYPDKGVGARILFGCFGYILGFLVNPLANKCDDYLFLPLLVFAWTLCFQFCMLARKFSFDREMEKNILLEAPKETSENPNNLLDVMFVILFVIVEIFAFTLKDAKKYQKLETIKSSEISMLESHTRSLRKQHNIEIKGTVIGEKEWLFGGESSFYAAEKFCRELNGGKQYSLFSDKTPYWHLAYIKDLETLSEHLEKDIFWVSDWRYQEMEPSKNTALVFDFSTREVVEKKKLETFDDYHYKEEIFPEYSRDSVRRNYYYAPTAKFLCVKNLEKAKKDSE